jgi:DNA invertase Pin-like site-specific DNA recombinase
LSGLRKRKLNDDQIREILARSEESQSRLALEFGVCRATIGNILRRKRRASDDIWSAVFMRLAA